MQPTKVRNGRKKDGIGGGGMEEGRCGGRPKMRCESGPRVLYIRYNRHCFSREDVLEMGA
jgi:hypothetical protein